MAIVTPIKNEHEEETLLRRARKLLEMSHPYLKRLDHVAAKKVFDFLVELNGKIK
jgi:hypothetical protein